MVYRPIREEDDMSDYQKLLEVYSLEELLELLELEPIEVLQLLADMGYSLPELQEPL